MAKILFLQNIWFEFLGSMSLIAYLREHGHQSEVVIGNDQLLRREVRNRNPDLVAFSVVTGYHHWALQMARQLKADSQGKIRVIMGGPHVTFFPETIERPEVDVICRGEGEAPLTELADALGDMSAWDGIANLWFKRDGRTIKNEVRPLLSNLDALPFPARDSFYNYPHIRDNPVKRFITGRGCPYICSFCFNHSYQELYQGKGTYIRKRSPENVIAELQAVKSLCPMKTVWFEDDLFGVFRPWLKDFFSLYRTQIGLPYICSFRADRLTEEIVRDLKESGCTTVVFGVETGNERLRNEVLCKNLKDRHILEAGRLLNRYELNFCTTNILGVPYETWEDALATIRFNLKLKPKFIWCSIFQPYPRTHLGTRLVREGIVRDLDLDTIDANYHSSSILIQKDIKRSVNLHKFVYVVFNHPWLLPIISRLCSLPPNPLFLLIHRVSFMLIFAKRWNISIWRAFLEGLRSGGFHNKGGGMMDRIRRFRSRE